MHADEGNAAHICSLQYGEQEGDEKRHSGLYGPLIGTALNMDHIKPIRQFRNNNNTKTVNQVTSDTSEGATRLETSKPPLSKEKRRKKTNVTCFKRPPLPSAANSACRGAFLLMENTHDALWVNRLQKSAPVIILTIILTMPESKQAEFLKYCPTMSRLIKRRPNDSSNIHTLWHKEPLRIKLELSGWGFPLWGGVIESGVSRKTLPPSGACLVIA
ncbi:uncharacterized [Tachysurus ichikawai]